MTDLELKKNVESELNFEPSINPAEIGVAAKDGIVTLTGRAQSYWEKVAAERASMRVDGVKAVVNEMTVRLPYSSERTDEDIAQAALSSLKWSVLIPADRVKVRVSKAWVTLEGALDWQFQKAAAEKAVRKLYGVLGVTNLLEVRAKPSTAQVNAEIEAALRRSANLDANRIKVEVEGDKVTLRGSVRSYFEREEAERAAWRALGVRTVANRITVGAIAVAA